MPLETLPETKEVQDTAPAHCEPAAPDIEADAVDSAADIEAEAFASEAPEELAPEDQESPEPNEGPQEVPEKPVFEEKASEAGPETRIWACGAPRQPCQTSTRASEVLGQLVYRPCRPTEAPRPRF